MKEFANIEFFLTPEHEIMVRPQGEAIELFSEEHNELIAHAAQRIRDRHPKAFKRLSTKYSKSQPNIRFFEFRMVEKFIRCNCSKYDQSRFDIDENGNFVIENVKCPLKGLNECPDENVICNPELSVKISRAEQPVLDMIIQNKTAAQIARELNLAEATINHHRTNIQRKVGVHSIAELITWYYRNK